MSDQRTTIARTFLRVQTKLQEVAELLSKQHNRKFKASHLQTEPSTWIVDMEGAPGAWTGTAFRFNEHTGTVITHPSADFSKIPGDRHEFILDLQSGWFTESGRGVTDEELVRRALETFVTSAVGI